VDTETTSLDAMRAELVGVSMCIEAGRACYIPLGHKGQAAQGALDFGDGGEGGEGAPEQVPLKRALEMLKPMLEDPGTLKIGQNIKYDALLLSRYGVAVAPVDDTMLLSYVLDGGSHGPGMDELAGLHLGHTTIKFKEVAGVGKAQVTFDHVALDKALDYAAEDADITLRLHRELKPRLLDEHMVTVYETIERPLIPVLMEMERAGIRVDPEVLRGLSRDFTQRMAGLEDEIHALAGEDFNVGSPKQLGEILFDKLAIEGGKKGKTGAYATGADVLEDLAAKGHDLPARVLDWRQLAKLKSTYSDALVEQINPDTGRVHTSFAMAGASTGRLASTDPNLQNIPVRTEEGRKIREAFVAGQGNRLVSLDYSQIELRIVAHMAGIDTLRRAFRDGQDIHAMTAAQVFGVPVEGMDPLIRRQAKAINFGIIYGISAFGLARQLGIGNGEAKAYIDAYFEKYPGIVDYMEAMKSHCRKHGEVETLFGRRIHIPTIADKNPARRNFGERQAINAPIQGSAADIIKRAMIRMPKALAGAKLDAVMMLQVHDELLFEVPEDQVEKTVAVVREIMEAAVGPALELTVPLVVDAGVADNWAEAH
jgi:DNA polymerase-1